MKQYSNVLTYSINRKGVFDIDAVKGCSYGMAKYNNGGCYGVCYANKISTIYGYDFSKSVTRNVILNDKQIVDALNRHALPWFRIGTFGDPSFDWAMTTEICARYGRHRTPIVVTKHWQPISDDLLTEHEKAGTIINTSISAMDSDDEIKYRLEQYHRIKHYGLRAVLRIVTARYGNTDNGKRMDSIQRGLMRGERYIDNPLRISANDARVLSGDIVVSERMDLNKVTTISVNNVFAYTGRCFGCPDQCGHTHNSNKKREREVEQLKLFPEKVELVCVESVLGSGYEKQVADLAIRDGVAYRAARPNMQKHSAVILKINGEFSGFFTFQVNHVVGEFCLLQSAMELDKKDKDIYKLMLKEIIKQNVYGYPMIMTVSTKHDLERPDVLEDVGFKTYLDLSGYAYMVYGTLEQVKLKRLAHATMTNAWTTTRADWLKMKREWNDRIEEHGKINEVQNPKYATREGCWQGQNGMANIVLSTRKIEDGEVKHNKGKTLNSNASVLDPVVCDVILRFFMPKNGRRVYNPFGGGVQFGFVSAWYGYEYLASEIRQNQCDANNKICSKLNSAKWIKSDSSTYEPDGMFDLVFSCPPYYKVEKYIDYDGASPDGEINSFDTYEKFRDTLFGGYLKAIKHLNDGCFFVIMTGDSRDKTGAYYCCEAEHEMFLKDNGLKIYNKIVYLECEFTRLAQAKVTLNTRKFPKREQKIICAYKGNIDDIKDLYAPIGRL